MRPRFGLEPVLQSLKQEIAQCSRVSHFDRLLMYSIRACEERANSYSARGGFSRENVQRALATIAKNLPVKALTIAGYDPSSTPTERSAPQRLMPSRPY